MTDSKGTPLDRLRWHVTGAVERGEAETIAGIPDGSAQARAYANGQDDARTGRGLSLSASAAEIAAYLAGAKAVTTHKGDV